MCDDARDRMLWEQASAGAHRREPDARNVLTCFPWLSVLAALVAVPLAFVQTTVYSMHIQNQYKTKRKCVIQQNYGLRCALSVCVLTN